MVTYGAFALRQFTDTWMVGQIGTESLAAVAASTQILVIIHSFGEGLASSLNTCASQGGASKGEREYGVYCWQTLWLALFLGTVAAQLVFFVPQLMGLFGHEYSVFVQEVAYLKIALWAVIPQFAAIALSNFFFAIRKPLIPMWVGILLLLINFGVNRVLIFGVGDLIPARGITGAAWGSLFCACLQVLCLFTIFLGAKRLRKFRPAFPCFHWGRVRSLLRIGLYNGLIDISDILFWNVGILYFIGQFGSAHLAAAAVTAVLMNVAFLPFHGVFVSVTTTVGHSAAKLQFATVHRQVRHARLVSLTVMGLISAAIFYAAPLIYRYMNGDELVWRIGQQIMPVLPVILLFSIWSFVTDGGLNGAGDARFTFLTVLLTNLSIIVGGSYFCTRYAPGLGSLGVWFCFLVNRAVIAILVSYRWQSGGWKRQLISTVSLK
jgi:multidrug resistance protein, MATE family